MYVLAIELKRKSPNVWAVHVSSFYFVEVKHYKLYIFRKDFYSVSEKKLLFLTKLNRSCRVLHAVNSERLCVPESTIAKLYTQIRKHFTQDLQFKPTYTYSQKRGKRE